MLYIGLVILTLFCAYQVTRAERLMLATIWLAGTSALIAILLYRMGAHEVAVIELSVGAGLVTVLFVFAFSIVGEDTLDPLTVVPRPLVWGTILFSAFLLGWFILPLQGSTETAGELSFNSVLWEQRGLDVLAQVVLIFAGVIGVMGLLSESREESGKPERFATLQQEVSLLPGHGPVLIPPDDHRPEAESDYEEVAL